MNKTDFNLPTPQMLIAKAKEETIPVSLRVKESTVAIFDKMAKEAGVNRGAMMNTWLDFYAQNQSSSNEDNSKNIMISFLNSERFWKTIPSLTPEELCYRMPSLDDDSSFCNVSNDAREIYEIYKGYPDEFPSVFIDEDTVEIGEEPSSNVLKGGTCLHVTAKQWPLVVVLLGEYRKKYKKLFPEQEYAITDGMYAKIAKACKQYENPDSVLATAIKNILLDFVEKQND